MDWGFAQVDQQWYKTPALLADAERMYAEVKPLQPKYWRIGAAWSLIAKQKNPGTFVAGTPPTTSGRDWSTVDTHLNEALLMGVEIVLIVGVRKASWGGFLFGIGATVGGTPDFASFCAEVATRYKPGGVGIRTDGKYAPNAGKGVRIFEIWNEQNDQNHWGGQISAQDYTKFLVAGYDAIKAVTGLTGTPTPGSSPTTGQSLVLFGGTYHVQRIGSWLGYGIASLPEIEFLKQCYTYGAKDKFDAMAVHVYPSLDQSSYGGSDVGPVPTMNLDNMKQLVEIRALMVAKGDGAKKIWVTEAGFPTSDVTDDEQRDYWEQLWDLFEALPYIQVVLFYCVRDPTTDTKSFANTWGAMRYDFSHKPVWSWLQTLTPPTAIPATFGATASMSATVSRVIVAAFSATSSMAAYMPPRVTAAFTADSGMSSLIDLPGFRNANFTAEASMSATTAPQLPITAQFTSGSSFTATVKPSLALSPTFTASATMAAYLSGPERMADFIATATMSAEVHIPVAWNSTGAGNRAAGALGSRTTSWTHNTTVTGTDVWAFVCVASSLGPSASSVGCTYGGTPMDFVGALNASGVNLRIYGLQNPPTGSQTVTATSSNAYSLQGTSVSFVNIGEVVDPAVGASYASSTSRSVTVEADAGSRALAITAGSNFNSFVSPTQRYNGGGSVSGNGDYVTVQDAPGEADGFVTLYTTQSSGACAALAIVLEPV